MVTSKRIRSSLLESVVNPVTDPFIANVLDVATPEYLRLKVLEELKVLGPIQSGPAASRLDLELRTLEVAITLLAIAKAQLTPPPAAKKPNGTATPNQRAQRA